MNEVIWSKKFKFHAWVKKCHFGNFTKKWLIGWIGHALLVQPSETAHWNHCQKKCLEFCHSDSDRSSLSFPLHSILGPKYCGWTPDAFLCDWIQNSPTLTFKDINKSILVGITNEFSSCYRNSKNSTRSYFNFHPLNSARTMKWIAHTIRSGEVCRWFYFEKLVKYIMKLFTLIHLYVPVDFRM